MQALHYIEKEKTIQICKHLRRSLDRRISPHCFMIRAIDFFFSFGKVSTPARNMKLNTTALYGHYTKSLGGLTS